MANKRQILLGGKMMELSDITNNQMIKELSLMYAFNKVMYGVDVTKEWETATQQAYALNQAYMRGREDERKRIEYLIEERLLLRLPCKEGDTVWYIYRGCTKCKEIKAYSLEWIVENLHRFGETLFITEEEAEAKLKELQSR